MSHPDDPRPQGCSSTNGPWSRRPRRAPLTRAATRPAGTRPGTSFARADRAGVQHRRMVHRDEESSARLVGDIDELADTAGKLGRFGAVFEQYGNLDQALDYYTRAHEYWKLLQDTPKVAASLRHLARIAARQGRIQDAVGLSSDAVDAYVALHDTYGAALAYTDRGVILTWANRAGLARAMLSQALHLFAALGPSDDSYSAALAELAYGVTLISMGEPDGGHACLTHAADELKRLVRPEGQPVVLNVTDLDSGLAIDTATQVAILMAGLQMTSRRGITPGRAMPNPMN